MVDKQRSKIALKVSGVCVGVGLAGFLMKQCFWRCSRRTLRRSRSLTKYEKSFRIPDSRAITLVKDFEEQLQQGLLEHSSSSLKMMPSWIKALPTGYETGEYYAIDVGGTNLRLMHCVLGDINGEVISEERKEIEIPATRKKGKVQNLFDFIVASFKIYLEMTKQYSITLNFDDNDLLPSFAFRNYDKEILKIGFCFSFPLRMEAVDIGYIEHLTKVI